jgi:ElaB/YqjD/DUF883 family membrane-anchored ribosome-binding protein
MANEENKDTQNTQNTQDFGSKTNFGGEQNSTANSSQNFGGGSGSGTSAKQAKDESSSTSGTTSGSAVETVKDTAKGVLDQAKETAGQAYGLATEKAATKLDEQKTTLAGGLTSVADSLKQVGGSLRESGEENPIAEFTAKYGDSLANQIEQIGSYFESKDVREMVRDIEGFARRNPAVFIGAAFGLGFLAARFLKSSSPQQSTRGAGQSFSASGTASNPS